MRSAELAGGSINNHKEREIWLFKLELLVGLNQGETRTLFLELSRFDTEK